SACDGASFLFFFFFKGRSRNTIWVSDGSSDVCSPDLFAYRGRHFTVDNVTLAPLPVQRPRPPVWIGGDSHAALRRAARWDGWLRSEERRVGKEGRSRWAAYQ